jgi:hypothetical protein
LETGAKGASLDENPQPFELIELIEPFEHDKPPKPPKPQKPPKPLSPKTFPFAVSAIIVNSPYAIFKKKIIQRTVNRFIQINFISSIDRRENACVIASGKNFKMV